MPAVAIVEGGGVGLTRIELLASLDERAESPHGFRGVLHTVPIEGLSDLVHRASRIRFHAEIAVERREGRRHFAPRGADAHGGDRRMLEVGSHDGKSRHSRCRTAAGSCSRDRFVGSKR
jgi:hypothetical protein